MSEFIKKELPTYKLRDNDLTEIDGVRYSGKTIKAILKWYDLEHKWIPANKCIPILYDDEIVEIGEKFKVSDRVLVNIGNEKYKVAVYIRGLGITGWRDPEGLAYIGEVLYWAYIPEVNVGTIAVIK